MLQARGSAGEAIEEYQLALALRPGDATVENALGAALLASNQISEAILHLSAAASARPDYFDAHYNLGIAQGTAGNFSAAVQELTTAVNLNPNDAGAHASLGAAYAGARRNRASDFAFQSSPGNRSKQRAGERKSGHFAQRLLASLNSELML